LIGKSVATLWMVEGDRGDGIVVAANEVRRHRGYLLVTQWLAKTSWYFLTCCSIFSISSRVGRAESLAGGNIPNRIMQSISSNRALVAVRFEPAISVPPPSANPVVLPRPVCTTG